MTTLKMNELNQVNGGMLAAYADAALAEGTTSENTSNEGNTMPYADDPSLKPFAPPHPPGTPRKRPDGDSGSGDPRRTGFPRSTGF